MTDAIEQAHSSVCEHHDFSLIQPGLQVSLLKLRMEYQIWAQSVLRLVPNTVLFPYLELLYEKFHHQLSL